MNDLLESSKALVDQLWKSYELLDDRRRKSFYYLITFMMVFGSLLVFQGEQFTLPGVQVKISTGIAIVIGPIFVLLSCLSYLYLSAHTLLAMMNYLENYCTANPAILTQHSVIEIHAMVKRRDITENLNPFHLFGRAGSIWDKDIPSSLLFLTSALKYVAVFVIVVSPLVLYIMLVNEINSLSLFNDRKPLKYAVLIMYVTMSAGFFIAPLYFYRRCKVAIIKYKRNHDEST